MPLHKFILPTLIASVVLLPGCAAKPHNGTYAPLAQQILTKCRTQNTARIGRFNSATDLLLANFDSKPDVDDLHAVAALGTLLKDPELACVDYLAIAGAYGTQGGEFIPAPALFDLAFGERWRDAHADRERALSAATSAVLQTLAAGGEIWIAEAGQSDFTAMLVQKLLASGMDSHTLRRMHLVQHSEWNENATTPAALKRVQTQLDYRKIPDGNEAANGSPGFNTPGGDRWDSVLADPMIGPIWAEARRLSDLHNGVAGYLNLNIEAGGFDFSDTSEAAYIFGMEHLQDTEAFFIRYSGTQQDLPHK